MKLYKFTFKIQRLKASFTGCCKTNHFAQWFFDKAPYGFHLLSYKECSEVEFKNYNDFTEKFTTDMVLENYKSSYNE